MNDYFVAKNMNLNGYHEVHTQDCTLLPDIDDLFYLGSFTNCLPAVEKAKRFFNLVTGCAKCSKQCAGMTEDAKI
jgi:hypothetical protein